MPWHFLEIKGTKTVAVMVVGVCGRFSILHELTLLLLFGSDCRRIQQRGWTVPDGQQGSVISAQASG